jgi:hypothetical protein
MGVIAVTTTVELSWLVISIKVLLIDLPPVPILEISYQGSSGLAPSDGWFRLPKLNRTGFCLGKFGFFFITLISLV